MQKIVTIQNSEYLFTNEVRKNATVRESFNTLATKTFGLSFENWHSMGYWGDDYIPYALLAGGAVVANASVNHMHTCVKGVSRHYIQIGTVMTDPAYRGRGLAAFLINKILADWAEKSDGIYLFANDSVLEFYPKFGFVKAEEYQCTLPISGGRGIAKQLDMDDNASIKLLLSAYQEGNPFSVFPMLHNEGLLIFYCPQFLKENVYLSEKTGAVVVAETEGSRMICSDIFGGNGHTLTEILLDVASADVTEAVLGFSPVDTTGMALTVRQEEDTTLFYLAQKGNPFGKQRLMFPLLSHA